MKQSLKKTCGAAVALLLLSYCGLAVAGGWTKTRLRPSGLSVEFPSPPKFEKSGKKGKGLEVYKAGGPNKSVFFALINERKLYKGSPSMKVYLQKFLKGLGGKMKAKVEWTKAAQVKKASAVDFKLAGKKYDTFGRLVALDKEDLVLLVVFTEGKPDLAALKHFVESVQIGR